MAAPPPLTGSSGEAWGRAIGVPCLPPNALSRILRAARLWNLRWVLVMVEVMVPLTGMLGGGDGDDGGGGGGGGRGW